MYSFFVVALMKYNIENEISPFDGEEQYTMTNYTEMSYFLFDLERELKEAKKLPFENQNQEYIARLENAISAIQKLKVYY